MQEQNIDIINNSKWDILKEIAENPQAATELAQKLDTSISNITQQLKILEAYNFVRKHKSNSKVVGKPKIIYTLNSEFVYALILREGHAERKLFKIEGTANILFNVLFLAGAEDVSYIMRFMVKYEEMFKKCKAVGFLRTTKDSLDLLIVTDYIDEMRSKFSNIFIEDINGKTKKIINWTHNEFEINDGMNRKDKYFLDQIRNVQEIWDPHNIIHNAKIQRDKI